MSELITFVVKNGNGQVYKFSKLERGFTYGSPLTDGVAKRGRPSKFPTETVIMSHPVTETSSNKVVKPVKKTNFLKVVNTETSENVNKPELVPAGGGNHVEEERVKGDNFLKLD